MPIETKPGALELVEYLDRAAAERLPVPGVLGTWPSETSLTPLKEEIAGAAPADRERLEVEARDLEDLLLLVVKRDVLPEGPLTDWMYTGPLPGVLLVAETPYLKVRADADMNLAFVFKQAFPLGGSPFASLNAQAHAVLCFELADEKGEALTAAKEIDLGDVVEGGLFVEVDAPAGRGFVSGRYEALSAYTDGKVLLVSFRPAVFKESNAPEEPLPFKPLSVYDVIGGKKKK